MDLESARGYSNEMRDLKERMCMHEPRRVEAHEELPPAERYKALGDRLRALPPAEAAHNPNRWQLVNHKFDEPDGTSLAIQMQGFYTPTEGRNLYNIIAHWYSDAGPLPEETLTDTADWDDPETLRVLGLLEDSVTALEQVLVPTAVAE